MCCLQLFEVVKGMPAFMLTNGLLKVICQVISIAADHPQVTVEDKGLILNDVFQMCKLVIIFAIRFVEWKEGGRAYCTIHCHMYMLELLHLCKYTVGAKKKFPYIT